jgi:uncharacterized membrane protein YhdT
MLETASFLLCLLGNALLHAAAHERRWALLLRLGATCVWCVALALSHLAQGRAAGTVFFVLSATLTGTVLALSAPVIAAWRTHAHR